MTFTQRLIRRLREAEAWAALAFILAGAAAWLLEPDQPWAWRLWFAGLLLLGTPVVVRTVRGVLARRFAADLVASLAIVTAVLLGEPLAGLIVVLMQTGGESLERYASARANDAIRQLEAAAPRVAHVILEGGATRDVPVDGVRPGDLLLVRPGELIPCDAVVEGGGSDVDSSPITGEPVPRSVVAGDRLLSGSVNGSGSLRVRALLPARESQYARIVELVRRAQASKSPLQRLADRYAVWFTPIVLAIALLAYIISGEAIRVLAVLVVATPCPLILATPVAVIGGINRAARRQIIIRHGGALEQIASVDTVAFDKTGTLTIGLPVVRAVRIAPSLPVDDATLVRLTAAVEAESGHLLARTFVSHVRRSHGALPVADRVREAPGQGVSAMVGGHRLHVGARRWVVEQAALSGDAFQPLEPLRPELCAYVAIDERAAAVIEYADEVRPGAKEMLARLATLGVRHTMLLTGDDRHNAASVAAALGITDVRAELLPEAKVAAVRELVDAGERVVMVGDGTNDAPALSAATVGVALAGHGGGITSEASDIVLLVDDVRRVTEAMEIGRRTLRIARQSIWAGLLLSGAAMLFAAAGHIPPTIGAFLQEGIDVAVILNALRASRSPAPSARDHDFPARLRGDAVAANA